MIHSLPLLLVGSCLGLAGAGQGVALEPGLRLVYRGGVSRVAEDHTLKEAEKTFRLKLVVTAVKQRKVELIWLVEESGRGEWPWIERAGQARLDVGVNLTNDAPSRPSLLYRRSGMDHVIPLPWPWLRTPASAEVGLEWVEGRRKYKIERATTLGKRSAWEIAVSDPIGRQGTIWLEQGRPLVLKIEQRKFMGRGEEHRLVMQLQSSEQLSRGRREKVVRDFSAITQLRDELKRPRRTESPDFSAAQLEVLRARLPQLKARLAGGSLEELARLAREDFTRQSGRANDVASLVSRFVGKPAGQFTIEGLDGARLSSEALKGHVTVLHFWDYRHEPLIEPYGQVGYLDFLHERHRHDGVRIYGVAVRRQFADAGRRAAAVRSVRKLRSFMNLGYPILLDNGDLLKQLGDPRTTGAALPLFVVFDRQGRIVHYHVGHYDVDKDLGLKELEETISAAGASSR